MPKSYVGEPFDYDLFVTYSHGDALGAGDSPLKRWSQAFTEQLKEELQTLPEVGGALSLFLDDSQYPGAGLNRMAELTPQLRATVEKSALLAVIMSPHYLKSQFCRDERESWHAGQAALGFPHQGRVALIRIWPLEKEAEWPPMLMDEQKQQLPGFWFFDRSEPPTACRPFEWPMPNAKSGPPFRTELVKVVSSMFLALQELRGRIEERQRVKLEAERLGGESQVIYLHGRTDQVTLWEQTSDQLASCGFTVLPSEPDPVEQAPEKAQAIRNRRVEMLSTCDALLLMGSQDGRAVDADLVSIGRHERQLARARTDRQLPCALLDVGDAAVATERRKRNAKQLQVDWLNRAEASWGTPVKSWLQGKGRELGQRT